MSFLILISPQNKADSALFYHLVTLINFSYIHVPWDCFSCCSYQAWWSATKCALKLKLKPFSIVKNRTWDEKCLPQVFNAECSLTLKNFGPEFQATIYINTVVIRFWNNLFPRLGAVLANYQWFSQILCFSFWKFESLPKYDLGTLWANWCRIDSSKLRHSCFIFSPLKGSYWLLLVTYQRWNS